MRSNLSIARNPLADLPEAMATLSREMLVPPTEREMSDFDRAVTRIQQAAMRRDQDESKRYAMNATVAHYQGVPTSSWPERQDILTFCLDKYIEHQALPVILPGAFYVEIEGVRFGIELEADPDERPKLFAVWSDVAPDCAADCGSSLKDSLGRCPVKFSDHGHPVAVVCPECDHLYFVEVRR